MSSPYVSRSVAHMLKCYGISALLAFGTLLIVPLFVNCTLLYYVCGILFSMPILAPVVARRIPKECVSPDGKAVFISGCDTGFGHILARRLDKLGFQVFAGCLFPDGEGATHLRNLKSNRLHVVGLDVTNDISVEEAANYIKENLKDNVLWAVVNNAGIANGGEIHWTDTETIGRVMDVNTMGVVRLTKCFLSSLQQTKGRVITVASLSGKYAIPGLVPYSMSKSAVIAFCDGLRQEMKEWGVQVITIVPALYRTGLTEKLMENAKILWERAPKEVKAMYPADNIDQFLKRFSCATKLFSNDPTEVVSVMENATMSLYPEHSYSVGDSLSLAVIWLAQMMPKAMADKFTNYVVKLMELW